MNESECVGKQLSVIARRLLLEVSQGLDWQWTRGEPPSSINLDEVVLNKSLDGYEVLLKTWHFLDTVVDARWHGFEKVDELSWDEVMSLLSIIAQD